MPEQASSERVENSSAGSGQAAITKIAVYRALFLGDLICALPALQALKARFPQAEITLIGLPWAEDFVRRAPAIDRLREFPGYPGINEVHYQPDHTAAFLAQARAEGYDLAIQMHGDGTVSNGFVAELGARATLGYRRGDDTRLTHSLPYQDDEHEVIRWTRLVAAFPTPLTPLPPPPPGERGNDTPCGTVAPLPPGGGGAGGGGALLPRLTLTARDHARARSLLSALDASSGPLVAMHVGAKDPARRWPPGKFAALADALRRRYGARVALTGGPNERELTQAVARAAHFPLLDLAGATDLGTFAGLLARTDLLVTNDTGASHLAIVTRTPSVVLFGPGRPEQWAPLDSQRHRAIDALAHAPTGTDPGAALAALPVPLVLAACDEVLLSARDEGRTTRDKRLVPSG